MVSKGNNQNLKKEEFYFEFLKNNLGLNYNREYLNKPESDFVVEMLSDVCLLFHLDSE